MSAIAKMIFMTVILSGGIVCADRTYTIKSRDTLGSVARQHGLTAHDLTIYNHLRNPDKLSIGQKIRIPDAAPTMINYVVKSGDTLSQIARKHGLKSAGLIRANKLSNANKLAIGQVLLIPRGPGATVSRRPVLPATVMAELLKIRISASKWEYVIVHHSATVNGTLKGLDRYHREERHMENGLAYHFLIGNGHGMKDGEIGIGARWRRQIRGGHLASEALNQKSIGICLVGNFEKKSASQKQMTSLKALTDYLTKRCRIKRAKVQPHRQINPKPTVCPGKHFKIASVWE